MDRKKLAIIVPYRNRDEHLKIFLDEMTKYIKKTHIKYEIIVINQDNAKLFNRGMLLNIGYIYAKQLECDYLVFHDVDMIPIDVDYSYSEIPLHLATNFVLEPEEKNREVFDQYFGGVTLFPIHIFKKINGYSNKYWGWGYEDTELLLRCQVNGIELNTMKIKNLGKNGKALKFNGIDSYVECKNIINLNEDLTIFLSFKPDKSVFDHTKQTDEFTIFSIPGWDFAICYNSFNRYNFCAFDTSHTPYFINSSIKPEYQTNMVITYDSNQKKIKVYQDGVLLGEVSGFKKLYFYKKQPNFYLGAGDPNRKEIPNFFKGTIDSFAYYDKILSDEEIKEISSNETHYLNNSFSNYNSPDSLKLYYDADFIENYELIDLTKNNINGKIVKCEIIEQNNPEYTEIKIPHRRISLFRSLKHEENGFLGNKWKDQSTRWNQLRYNNEISNNHDLMNEDGLSTLQYLEHGQIYNNKILHVNVGL